MTAYLVQFADGKYYRLGRGSNADNIFGATIFPSQALPKLRKMVENIPGSQILLTMIPTPAPVK